MSPSITNTMRRFSRSSSQRNSGQSNTSTGAPAQPSQQSPTTYTSNTGAFGSAVPQSAPNGGAIAGVGQDNSRPVSAASNSSFDFMNRPVSQSHGGIGGTGVGAGAGAAMTSGTLPSSAIGGLSRTDQVVLRYFWEDKYADNAKRDLHFLKFPFFPEYPGHTDLMPYCEIYHLVKTSPGASIISLGSANGVYIGFELAQGAQLHIDMDDEWRDISHHRVMFKPYETMLRDPTSDATFKTWPKPLTIEFLEEQYRKWMLDLTSFCWIDEPVRELGASHTAPNGGVGSGLDEKEGRGEI